MVLCRANSREHCLVSNRTFLSPNYVQLHKIYKGFCIKVNAAAQPQFLKKIKTTGATKNTA